MKKVALYVRVSTHDQDPAMQLSDLKRYVQQRGFSLYKEYVDVGISGTKVSRPALDALMSAGRKRLFDVVLVWRFDRFARSTKHLVDALHEFRSLRILRRYGLTNLDVIRKAMRKTCTFQISAYIVDLSACPAQAGAQADAVV